MNSTNNQNLPTAVKRELSNIRTANATAADYRALLKAHKPLIDAKPSKTTARKSKDKTSLYVVYVFGFFAIVSIVLTCFKVVI